MLIILFVLIKTIDYSNNYYEASYQHCRAMSRTSVSRCSRLITLEATAPSSAAFTAARTSSPWSRLQRAPRSPRTNQGSGEHHRTTQCVCHCGDQPVVGHGGPRRARADRRARTRLAPTELISKEVPVWTSQGSPSHCTAIVSAVPALMSSRMMTPTDEACVPAGPVRPARRAAAQPTHPAVHGDIGASKMTNNVACPRQARRIKKPQMDFFFFWQDR
jgi:hypothetical protein